MKKIHWTLETLSCKVVWFLSTVIFVLLDGDGPDLYQVFCGRL